MILNRRRFGGGRLKGVMLGITSVTPPVVTPPVTTPTTPPAGPTITPVPTITPTGAANRFDATFAVSVSTVGTAQTLTLRPNGIWPASGTLTPSASNGAGTFTPTSITLAGGTSPVTLTYTPTQAGEHAVKFTNSMALNNPYPAPLNAFPSSSGTARTIAANIALLDQAVHQRDVPIGIPTGFTTNWARGWGEVWIDLSALSGASDGVFIRLYDALSAGASSTVGTGTALTGVVQVYGSVSATGEITVLLPAGPFVYYADIATDAAFTSPIRLTNRFKVGHVRGFMTRSQESGEGRAYPYGSGYTGPFPANVTTSTYLSFDGRYSRTDPAYPWYTHDGVSPDNYQYAYGETSSTGTMELGRLVDSALGVCVGLVGAAGSGGGLDLFVAHDGTVTSGFCDTARFASRGKFRDFFMGMGGWDGVDSAYPTEVFSESMARYAGATQYVINNFPACAVISIACGASGWFGSDGSRATGYTRLACAIANTLETTNPMVVSRANLNWNEFYNGHATMGARQNYVRSGFRQGLAGEVAAWGGLQVPALLRGPSFVGTGSLVASSRTIRLPIKLNGGASLVGVKASFSNPNISYSAPTSSEQAMLVAVYLPGGYNGNGTAIRITTATINTSNLPSGCEATLDVVLAGTSGLTFVDGTTAAMPSSLTVHYGADLAASSTQGREDPVAVFFTDDRVDAVNGIPFGWELRPAVDMTVTVS